MKNSLILAFGLMLIIEGLLPFIAPKAWRDTFKRLMELSDGQLRFMGLMSLVGGLLMMYFFGN